MTNANGSYNTLSGYPKVFDSKVYDNDVDKTLRCATAEYYDTLGTLLKRDDRQLQTVLLMTADGFIVESNHIGQIAELADTEPEEEEESL